MAETRRLLIDADIVAYLFAAKGQEIFQWDENTRSMHVEPFENIAPQIDDYLLRLADKYKADEMIVCLSCPTSKGWRIKILPTYKQNRVDAAKPELLLEAKAYLRSQYKCIEKSTMEADDVLGILSTHPTLLPGKNMIVSADKDLQTIPGWYLNPAKDKKARLITRREADYRHMLQTLTGDSVDGYRGCPGIGPVKAAKILEGFDKAHSFANVWGAVCGAFENQGLTEEDALVQARVARICRYEDYDFEKKEVKLWAPPTVSQDSPA